jgi:hypothetical protein
MPVKRCADRTAGFVRQWILEQPICVSVFVCLKEKGLPFETREVNLHERPERTAISVEVGDGARADAGAQCVPIVGVERNHRV